MNQVVDQNNKCNQENAISKNSKKAKESTDMTYEIGLINHEHLADNLANSLNINNVSSSLTNGTSDHAHKENDSNLKNGSKTHNAQDIDVNSVQSSKDNNDDSTEDIKSVRDIVEEALENLETALNLQEKPSQDIEIVSYESELQMPEIIRLIQKDLSEPYSIYTYRYFIHNWPKLCFLARHEGKCIGAIVCKLDLHHSVTKRGYIAMLAVDEKYRKRKIGSRLVQKAIQVMYLSVSMVFSLCHLTSILHPFVLSKLKY